jgi:photosystem II stability/assembly factor-like uncharacterized protein
LFLQLSASQYSLILISSNIGATWSTALKILGSYSVSQQKLTVGRVFGVAAYSTGASTSFAAVSETGQVYVSMASGLNWKQAAQLPASLYSISIGRNGAAYAVGLSNTTANSIVFKAYNTTSYASWQPLTLSSSTLSVQLNGVNTYNGIYVYVVGASGLLLRSSDGGNTWASSYPGTSTCQGVDLYSVSVAGGSSGII